MKWLPQADSRLLRLVLVGMAMAGLWLAVGCFRMAVAGQYVSGVLSLVFLSAAAGLWVLMPWARYLSLVILWLLVLVVPMNAGPFAAIDGPAPPGPIWDAVLHFVAPTFVPATIFLEMLYAYKHEFRWPHDAHPVEHINRTPTMLPRSWILWCISVFGVPALLIELLGLNTGCIPGPVLLDTAPRWTVQITITAAVGLVAFLIAAPVKASWPNRITRAVVYSFGMVWFYSNVSGYLRFVGFCP